MSKSFIADIIKSLNKIYSFSFGESLNQYINFIYKFRWPTAILIPFLIVILSFNLKYFKIDGSYRVWFKDNSPILQTYDAFTDEFGDDINLYIVFQDKHGIFNQKALKSIENLTEAFETSPYVESVNSLINYKYIHQGETNQDEIIVDDFIKDLQESTPYYLEQRKQIAIHDKYMVDNIISKDGTTTMMTIKLDIGTEENNSTQILKSIKKIIKKESDITGYKYWINGSFVMKQEFVNVSQDDLNMSIPISILLAIITLYIFFRKSSGIFLPLSIVVLTAMSVVSVYILLGYQFNTLTVSIPLFIIAIGIADAIHIYTLWYAEKVKGTENFQAVSLSLSKNILPIFLTSLTSIVGFSSLVISDIVPVSTLGIATGTGIILAFLISITWMPSVLFLLDKDIKPKKIKNYKVNFNYGLFIIQNRKKIIAIFLFIITVTGTGITSLTVDSNMIKFFAKEVEIRKSSDFIMKNLTGIQSYEVVVDSGKEGDIKDPDFLKTIDRFYTDYYDAFSDVRYISSFVDIIKQYNKVANNSNTVPDNRNLIAQYLLLHTISLPSGSSLNNQINFEQSKLRITILTDMTSSNQSLKMIDYIQQWWSQTPYKVIITGKTAMNASLHTKITDTLMFSLLLTILLVSIMMFSIFKKIKLLWIIMLPNILPVIVALGVMGWLNINLDMGMAITGAIIISIAIDDSIHYLVKYFHLEKQNLSQEFILNEVLNNAGKAMIFTTILLSLTFLINIFSDFIPNRNFAIVTSIGLCTALIIDILLLPALLTSRINKKK